MPTGLITRWPKRMSRPPYCFRKAAARSDPWVSNNRELWGYRSELREFTRDDDIRSHA